MVRLRTGHRSTGARVDLRDYAIAHREELILKPTLLHGGAGVVPGWHRETTRQAWAEQLRAAMDGPYVLQRRIRPVPELFPTLDGSRQLTPGCCGGECSR